MTTIDCLNEIKSRYILENIIKHLEKIKFLEVIRYNKSLQNKINITLNGYKEFASIELEVLFEPELPIHPNLFGSNFNHKKENDLNFRHRHNYAFFSHRKHHNSFNILLDTFLNLKNDDDGQNENKKNENDFNFNLQNDYRINFDPIINVTKENSQFFHFYYNDNTKEEEKKEFLMMPKSVTKMKIKIDANIKSFAGLFKGCGLEKLILSNLREIIFMI